MNKAELDYIRDNMTLPPYYMLLDAYPDGQEGIRNVVNVRLVTHPHGYWHVKPWCEVARDGNHYVVTLCSLVVGAVEQRSESTSFATLDAVIAHIAQLLAQGAELCGARTQGYVE